MATHLRLVWGYMAWCPFYWVFAAADPALSCVGLAKRELVFSRLSGGPARVMGARVGELARALPVWVRLASSFIHC